MASLSKFLKSPKAYTAKKINVAKKTIKDQPTSLAATALLTLAQMAQDNTDFNRQAPGSRSPGSSMLHAAGTMVQGWQNAKAASKKNARTKIVEGIVNAPNVKNEDGTINPKGIKTMDKISQLISMGEHKTAGELMKLHGLQKAIKNKKKTFSQKVKMDDFHIDNENRNFEENKKNTAWEQGHKTAVFENSKANTDWEHKHTTGRDSVNDSHWDTEQAGKNKRAVVNAIGQILRKGGTPEQLLSLLSHGSLASGIETKTGIPFLTKTKITINKPHYIDEDETDSNKKSALKKFVKSIL
jgi:hypothetical protein